MAATVKHSWRHFYKVHPSADKFPLLPQDELEALANHIEKNGLKVKIQTRRVGSLTGGWSEVFVIDGRNRLDAMEKVLRWKVVHETDGKGHWAPGTAMQAKRDAADNWQSRNVEHKDVATHKEIAVEIIALNVRRRHLTKAQQAELIVEALRAARTTATTDHVNMTRSVKRGAGGRLQGSTKDPEKTTAVEQGSKLGISKTTMERVLARKKEEKRDGAKPKPKRRNRFETDKTGKGAGGEFDALVERWPFTLRHIVKARVVQHLFGRWDCTKTPAKFVAPVSVKYADGKTLTITEMFEEWQRVLDEPA